MTKKQMEQFNRMLSVLRKISRDYQTPDQLRLSSGRDYGLSYNEALEMAYENLQNEAACAVKGIKSISTSKISTICKQ